MSWNYRIMRHKAKNKDGEDYLGLHEYFNFSDGETSWTRDSLIGYYFSKASMITTLEMMLKDAKKKLPILDYERKGKKK